MDFCPSLHLIYKHTAMTNKEILQASLLDIVFENRNKGYGAYTLRKDYNTRLLIALAAGMSFILFFILISLFGKSQQSLTIIHFERGEVMVRELEMLKEKPKQPEKPKEVMKQKPGMHKVATVKFTTPPAIKEDNKVKGPIAAINDLTDKYISDKAGTGIKADGISIQPQQPSTEPGTGESEPVVSVQKDFEIDERDPEFPGGAEAFKRFLNKNLITPDELLAGERKVVLIKFKVDKDGTVTGFEIVTSGGNDFDREVVRVCKKMPRWKPAMQNGITVTVSYVLPVTFLGLEQ